MVRVPSCSVDLCDECGLLVFLRTILLTCASHIGVMCVVCVTVVCVSLS